MVSFQFLFVIDNIERGCDRFGEKGAIARCEGWLLQELSSAHGQGPDCYSFSTKVCYFMSVSILVVLNVC